MRIIGIDPGKNGGLACIETINNELHVTKMPATERDLFDTLAKWHDWPSNHKVAFIEKVGVMPGEGVSGAFSFGQNYGMLRGFLIALGIQFEAVVPGTWQRGFSLPTQNAAGSKTAKKNAHKARAQELFPAVKITHAIADALLIMEYGRRVTRPDDEPSRTEVTVAEMKKCE